MAKGDGWVYVLTNEAMPGLVKVGCTSKTPEIRAEELSGETSAPGPFAVAYAAFVSSHKQVETIIHRELKAAGFHHTPEKPKKEFFKCDPLDAIECIRKNVDIKYEQLNEECVKYEEVSISCKNGSAYSGECKISSAGLKLPHGHGSWTYSDGDRYVGEWKEGIWHGEGSLTIPGVGEYVGRWKNGKKNGYGTHADSDGGKYVGNWKDGKRDGQGTRTWRDGRVYVGEWRNNKRHGQGTLTWPNGQKIVGNFYKDNYHGKMRKTDADGASTEHLYEYGKLVTITSLPDLPQPSVPIHVEKIDESNWTNYLKKILRR